METRGSKRKRDQESVHFANVNPSEVDALSRQVTESTVKCERNWIHCFNAFLTSINEEKHFDELDEGELIHHLPNFILAARKHDGRDYHPSTLKTGVFSLVRAFSHRVDKVYDIRKDEVLHQARNVLDNRVKQLQRAHKYEDNSAIPFTREDIRALLKSSADTSTPRGLILRTFILLALHTGRRVLEHHNLEVD